MTCRWSCAEILLGDPKTVRTELDKETTEGNPINFSRRWDLISSKKPRAKKIRSSKAKISPSWPDSKQIAH